MILLLFISIIGVTLFTADRDDFDISRREVLLRRIGHEILLQSGDSTSRVLPVEKIGENEYQIKFENELTFQTDSLVNTTQRLLAKDLHVRDYVVNVINCDNSSVAYGYAISKNKKDDIVACKGRKQPSACYKINIKFKPIGILTASYQYFLVALLLFGLVGFFFWKPKPKQTVPKAVQNNIFTLGSVLFDAQKRQLEINNEKIDLTATETRLLLIFASSPNETIERSRLQKEIWEDEGVIVGRSLDMFISKLRKKLELDTNINIVVIRGKGYKLEVNT
ncbi:winged helix-turn-helix domain-containing protein [Flavobacterium lacisediminis]|uniref:Winged helix-turn-helix domain-containing protein n=1 Tax=Flavobacterium lacisediminis TaxID=2989705 RepID=A0ABT3ELB0_9FLAO|nr:winged helix-turn-helix domain-containing protein [Flavobacterium lacisediminis]MCW1148895.1 winged helix-turn-helix domain-containing protein [Flavobacterium lacisediminis]